MKEIVNKETGEVRPVTGIHTDEKIIIIFADFVGSVVFLNDGQDTLENNLYLVRDIV